MEESKIHQKSIDQKINEVLDIFKIGKLLIKRNKSMFNNCCNKLLRIVTESKRIENKIHIIAHCCNCGSRMLDYLEEKPEFSKDYLLSMYEIFNGKVIKI